MPLLEELRPFMVSWQLQTLEGELSLKRSNRGRDGSVTSAYCARALPWNMHLQVRFLYPKPPK